MKKYLQSVGSVLVTLIAVAIASVVAFNLWNYYHDAPWTRDAHVRADVVQVAPDVSGLVTAVRVGDNQPVQQGQPLFVIDQARYQLALAQARAVVEERQASLAQLQRESSRNHVLNDLVSKEIVEEGRAKVAQAQAALDTAKAALGVAELNLQRTVVLSPVDGFISDRSVRLGDYVSAGKPVLSVVDRHSIYVDGYFEETKLRHVQVGQRVRIRLMGEPALIYGHVQSIAAGIEDRDRVNGSNLLPNVNPTFNWVRLAQRIPVRIAIDQVPQGVRLIAGRTATVTIEDGTAHAGADAPASPRSAS